MVDLTQIVVAILTLVFSLVSAFLIPYIKTKVTAELFGSGETNLQVSGVRSHT